MYRKDQIKGIIAIILFGIIGLTYLLTKDDDIAVIVSSIAFVVWLISMYILNRRT
ncbi:MAG: hypothetical protein WD530_00935 [Vicingaceae bacterium]